MMTKTDMFVVVMFIIACVGSVMGIAVGGEIVSLAMIFTSVGLLVASFVLLVSYCVYIMDEAT